LGADFFFANFLGRFTDFFGVAFLRAGFFVFAAFFLVFFLAAFSQSLAPAHARVQS